MTTLKFTQAGQSVYFRNPWRKKPELLKHFCICWPREDQVPTSKWGCIFYISPNYLLQFNISNDTIAEADNNIVLFIQRSEMSQLEFPEVLMMQTVHCSSIYGAYVLSIQSSWASHSQLTTTRLCTTVVVVIQMLQCQSLEKEPHPSRPYFFSHWSMLAQTSFIILRNFQQSGIYWTFYLSWERPVVMQCRIGTSLKAKSIEFVVEKDKGRKKYTFPNLTVLGGNLFLKITRYDFAKCSCRNSKESTHVYF